MAAPWREPLVDLHVKPDRLGSSADWDVHRDLVWTLLGEKWTTDSYYLTIDPDYQSRWPKACERSFKLRAVADLLRQWLEHLRNAKAISTIYLPFDWSDQCSGQLRCELANDMIGLRTLWSDLEGWKFNPSNISPIIREPMPFGGEPAPEVTVSKKELVTTVGALRMRLLDELPD